MAKAQRKAIARLKARQDRWEAFVSRLTHEQRRGYKKPGSFNSHKGK